MVKTRNKRMRWARLVRKVVQNGRQGTHDTNDFVPKAVKGFDAKGTLVLNGQLLSLENGVVETSDFGSAQFGLCVLHFGTRQGFKSGSCGF